MSACKVWWTDPVFETLLWFSFLKINSLWRNLKKWKGTDKITKLVILDDFLESFQGDLSFCLRCEMHFWVSPRSAVTDIFVAFDCVTKTICYILVVSDMWLPDRYQTGPVTEYWHVRGSRCPTELSQRMWWPKSQFGPKKNPILLASPKILTLHSGVTLCCKEELEQNRLLWPMCACLWYNLCLVDRTWPLISISWMSFILI